MLVVGAAAGWEGRGWWDGSTQTTATATKSANKAVKREVKADREIVTAEAKTATAITSAEASIANTTVDPSCPPGRGRVSGPVADKLRLEFSKKD